MYLAPYTLRPFGQIETSVFPWERGVMEPSPYGTVPELHLRASPWDPPADFVEEKDRFILFLDAPGMRKEDIEVEMTDGILYVKGQRQHEPEVGEGMPLVLERQCGGFARHFHLHSDVLSEGIRADYSAGILKVTIPKSPKSQSRTVPIHVS